MGVAFYNLICYTYIMFTGISTLCFNPNIETEDSFKLIKEAGAETCEAALRTFYEYRPEFAEKCDVAGLDVRFVSAFPPNFEAQLFSRSRRVRGDGFYWLDQILRSAQLLGAKNYIFRGAASDEDINFITGRLNEISGFCMRYGVNLCIENSVSGLYSRPEHFARLKAGCPQLSGSLSLKSAALSGFPWQMYVKDMQGCISYIHLSDVDSNGKTCLPGKGLYDFNQIFKVLKDCGFDGNSIIETCLGDYGDLQELSQSLEYLNDIIYKLK